MRRNFLYFDYGIHSFTCSFNKHSLHSRGHERQNGLLGLHLYPSSIFLELLVSVKQGDAVYPCASPNFPSKSAPALALVYTRPEVFFFFFFPPLNLDLMELPCLSIPALGEQDRILDLAFRTY